MREKESGDLRVSVPLLILLYSLLQSGAGTLERGLNVREGTWVPFCWPKDPESVLAEGKGKI